jgi:hypothetical protein
MVPANQRAIKAVAFFLVFAVVQLYVGASSIGAQTAAQGFAAQRPQSSGILSTTNNRNILADKNEVSTGATILDGMTLETTDCVAATVRWGTLEEVNLGTNSVATINHSDGRVKVTLKQGCASVRGVESDDLTIITPDGQVTPAARPDGPGRKSEQVCFPSGIKSEFSPTCARVPAAIGAGPVFGSAGIGGVLVGAAGEIALIVVALVGTRGENPSSKTP